MKAIQVQEFGDPDVLRLEELPDPELKAGQVLIQVHAAGVNPYDTYARAGTLPWVSLPYIPGADAAGIVKAVGEGVSQVAVGDRVYAGNSITGSYAELSLYDQSQVHSLPQDISFAQGAAVHSAYTTAYRR